MLKAIAPRTHDRRRKWKAPSLSSFVMLRIQQSPTAEKMEEKCVIEEEESFRKDGGNRYSYLSQTILFI
jgi:hypothetical protein